VDDEGSARCCQSNENLSPLGGKFPHPSLRLARNLPPLSQGG
jgi:hypothetical protein